MIPAILTPLLSQYPPPPVARMPSPRAQRQAPRARPSPAACGRARARQRSRLNKAIEMMATAPRRCFKRADAALREEGPFYIEVRPAQGHLYLHPEKPPSWARSRKAMMDMMLFSKLRHGHASPTAKSSRCRASTTGVCSSYLQSVWQAISISPAAAPALAGAERRLARETEGGRRRRRRSSSSSCCRRGGKRQRGRRGAAEPSQIRQQLVQPRRHAFTKGRVRPSATACARNPPVLGRAGV